MLTIDLVTLDPEIPLLGIYSGEMKHTSTPNFRQMIITDLFKRNKN